MASQPSKTLFKSVIQEKLAVYRMTMHALPQTCHMLESLSKAVVCDMMKLCDCASKPLSCALLCAMYIECSDAA